MDCISRFVVELHYSEQHLKHSAPHASKVHPADIRPSSFMGEPGLSFHISFDVAARKSPRIPGVIFEILISSQTVLNYAAADSPYRPPFKRHYKGIIDEESAEEEDHIKILGTRAFVFLFIPADNRKITAYHVAFSRDTLPATVVMTDARRTAKPGQHSPTPASSIPPVSTFQTPITP